MRSRRLVKALRAHRSELVVVSQGLNYDGWFAGQLCRELGIPYVMVSQKASDLYWPPDSLHERLRDVYRDAAAACFVSDHNRRLTEEQLGLALPQAMVVRNPFNADWYAAASWPELGDRLRLGCIARLDAREKGQDLLLRVMAAPKWRARPLTVRLYGAGPNERGLRAMAAKLDLTNIEFGGFVADPQSLWADLHGLVLPSRCEGLPLSLIEAMLNARVAIVTDVGGNGEAVTDNATGFIAAAPTEASLDEAMERAWQRREEWQAIGQAVRERARSLVEPDPARTFADRLLTMVER